ncbi:MAG: succinate dehydrogenase [Rhodothermaceae bacterium]|nr:succinate dehydrogenase [Rhodothermaceae bacterium]
MASKYGATARSSAFQWFLHRITGTFLVFLLITHFWVQHYDRTTASIAHNVVTAEAFEQGQGPVYQPEAVEAVREMRTRMRRAPAEGAGGDAFGEAATETPIAPVQDATPEASGASVTSYDVLMLRLADPVYAGLWKAFNLLFLAFALHHGFYGLSNIITDYVRNDMLRVGLSALSWTVALVLFVIGAYSVIVAGLNY